MCTGRQTGKGQSDGRKWTELRPRIERQVRGDERQKDRYSDFHPSLLASRSAAFGSFLLLESCFCYLVPSSFTSTILFQIITFSFILFFLSICMFFSLTD